MNVKKLFHRYPNEIFFFFATLFIRFPFFFRDYIDLDESTFILMGQSIADGHLPYDNLWDLKPPLLFYFFGVIEKVFPHSFFAIRLFGVIVIFLSAVLLMRIARRANLRNGFLIAAGYIVLSSEFGSLQGVMSEHLSVLFLLLGLFLFLRKTKTPFLSAGMAFGCAMLCKLNYAYAIVLLQVFYLANEYRKGNVKQSLGQVLALTAGICIPVFLIAAPFIVSGKTALFINSVFLAPMQYAKALGMSWTDKLKTCWWIISLTGVIAYWSVRVSKAENKKIVFCCIAILAGTVYTFFSSGIVNGHYLVQVYPFLLMLIFGVLVQKSIRPTLGIAAIVIVFLSVESLLEYVRIIKTAKDRAAYRPTFEVVRELKKRKLDEDKIFFASYHIGYWLLHQYPLTKSTTHPSNLSRPFLFPYFNNANKTSLQELQYILEQIRPQVIVSESADLHFFPGSSSENLYFSKSVNENYQMIYMDPVDRIYIWQRRPK
jgi:hypothetical protein